jgi:ubiquinone/menaquinone biosynthesis C-methylase UbiE
MLHERHRTAGAALSALVVALGTLSAQQQRDPKEYAQFLESRERVERMEVARVVEALRLQPGSSVADLGSGSGLFTRALARAVAPGGTAFAVDIDPDLLKIVEASAKRSELTNVQTVLAGPNDPKLPQPVDLVFICDTFHHLPDKAAYARTLWRYIKPGGRVAVIDFTNDWPGGHDTMRYTPDELEGWMTAAGFTRDQMFDFPKNSFYITYKKAAQQPVEPQPDQPD